MNTHQNQSQPRLWGSALIGLFIILPLIYILAAYPLEYTMRVLRWRNADVLDYQKFPARELVASSSPFQFQPSIDTQLVQTVFENDARIDDLDQFLEESGTQGFIVIQDNAILYEKYYNGADQQTTVTSFSVAKSFTSILIGIAIEEGFIQDVHDPITDYLPELLERDPRFEQISIRDLLLMSSGIEYAEFPFLNGDDAKTYYYPDLRALALEETAIVGEPGEGFLYNNYHPLLLGLILERATGQPVSQYLSEKIWSPMGAEFSGSWSLDENGFEKMESGINGRAIDFAKFGYLVLNEGNINDQQIVPQTWIQEATRSDPQRNGSYYPTDFHENLPGGFYKYMWWGKSRDAEAQDDDISAIGNHGQFIYVSPSRNLIIVRHGERYGITLYEWIDLFYSAATQFERRDQ